ncbi:hypothetical protein RHSIM_Rhsim13G0022800 [Rhododendron simsii]|uniref:Phorbol-ester/DAG-type domain-containing protein n=1 Tax=Rhododendron simsii TaxID=118357 RepID=A0A834G1E2_RHOSS|nr:hypothetical protein RHSIM_Rhsim13G0022800 [Rhododendron simsii]
MGYTEKTTQRTFDLKLNLHCKNCAKYVRKIVLEIEGVDSIDIDEDLELGKATISGNVDPQTVIKKLKDAKKHAKLLGKEEEERPPEEMQIVLQQNPVRIDQRKVVPQPPGLICKSVDKPMEREIHGCDPNAYQLFKFLGLISETVDKPMEMKIHDCLKHDHELEPKSYNKPFKCNRCREDGFTLGYRCKHCSYGLHKGCLNPKPEITHDLFPGSIFKFCEEPGNFCDACGMEIHGHSYSCKEDGLDLHPACSKLPGKLPISGRDFVLCKEFKYKCFWCKREKPSWLVETKFAGLCYVSKRDKFSCHVHCLSLVMQENWKRGRGDLDPDDDNDDANDAISKVLVNVDLKRMTIAKGSGGKGGGKFPRVVTVFLKTIISILFGDPTGLIVCALSELVK